MHTFLHTDSEGYVLRARCLGPSVWRFLRLVTSRGAVVLCMPHADRHICTEQ